MRSLAHSRVQEMKKDDATWQALQEDLDLIQIYLGTNRNSPGCPA